MFLLDSGTFLVLAYLLTGFLRLVSSPLERAALAILLALGIKSLVIFFLVAGQIQPDIYRQTGIGLGALVLVATVYRRYLLSLPYTPPLPSWYRPSPMVHLAMGVLAVLVLLSFGNAAYFPITESDGIWYHIKGMVYYHETGLDSLRVDPQMRQYPPFVPLIYAYFISLGWGKLKVLFSLLYLCLLVIVYHRLGEQTRDTKVAALFTLALGTTPLLWWHSGLPFLDLAAGAFYSIGILYWFSWMKLSDNPGPDHGDSSPFPLAMLSGIFLGLAAWTRWEFVLYAFLPSVLLIVSRREEKERDSVFPDRAIAGFFLSMLFLPTLWGIVLIYSSTPLVENVLEVLLAGLGLWGLAGVAWLTPRLPRSPRFWKGLGIFLAVVLVLVLASSGHKKVSSLSAVAISLFRTVAVNGFYLFTPLVLALLVAENPLRRSGSARRLGWAIAGYFLIHFIVFTYAEPKWRSLGEYAIATFLRPGDSINLSDTRGLLGVYPLLVFLAALVPGPADPKPFLGGLTRWNWIVSIVVLNLVVLIVVFVTPRTRFVMASFGLAPEQIMETRGSGDMPNMFGRTYEIANRVHDLTGEGAEIFLPPGDREAEFSRAAAIQRLFPRTLHFGDDPDYDIQLESAGSGNRSFYFVSSEEWHPGFCEGKQRMEINLPHFGLCRVGSPSRHESESGLSTGR